MSEDPAVVPVQTDAGDAQQTTPSTDGGRRGRPRPQATIERDEKVRALLAERGAMTRTGIAEALGWESKEAYASLWRLRHYESAVEKVQGKSEWQLTAADDAPGSE